MRFIGPCFYWGPTRGELKFVRGCECSSYRAVFLLGAYPRGIEILFEVANVRVIGPCFYWGPTRGELKFVRGCECSSYRAVFLLGTYPRGIEILFEVANVRVIGQSGCPISTVSSVLRLRIVI